MSRTILAMLALALLAASGGARADTLSLYGCTQTLTNPPGPVICAGEPTLNGANAPRCVIILRQSNKDDAEIEISSGRESPTIDGLGAGSIYDRARITLKAEGDCQNVEIRSEMKP